MTEKNGSVWFKIADFLSAITLLDTDLLLDASASRLVPFSVPDQPGDARPCFYETRVEFVTCFGRLEAFPRFSCSSFCKYLLQIWQDTRKPFLNFSWMKKRGNA